MFIFLIVWLQTSQVPLSLQMAEQQRLNLGGVRILWSEVSVNSTTGEAIDRSYRSAFAANGDFAFEELGNGEGVLQAGGDGAPAIKTSRGTLMKANGETWQYMNGFTNAMYWDDRSASKKWQGFIDLKDPRSIGLNVDVRTREIGLGDTFDAADVVEYREIREGDIYKVTAVNGRGASATWHINPAKGWNPELITVVGATGREVARLEVSLREYDGLWFPEAATRYQMGELICSIVIDVNRDDSLKSLEPAEIGLEPGARIFGQEGAFGKQASRVWDGERNVTLSEWSAAVESGLKRRGPKIAHAWEYGVGHLVISESPATDALLFAGVWQRYVVRFVTRYRLDKEQTERAWQVYGACRKKGERYLAGKKAEIRRLDQLLKDQSQDSEKLARLKTELRAPLDRIFENELIPRLDKLPTQAQRDRVETDESDKQSPHFSNGRRVRDWADFQAGAGVSRLCDLLRRERDLRVRGGVKHIGPLRVR